MSKGPERIEEANQGAGAGRDSQRVEQAEPVRDTVPVSATTEEEEREFHAGHHADRPPTPEEEADAEAHGPLDPEVAAQARAAAERGARVKGEGEIV
jgi:hypothetical protein